MRWPVMKFSALALLIPTSLISPAHAQWRYSAYMQTSAGNYIYTSIARNYYLTQGLQYRQERWSLDANMSLAARDGDNLVVRGEGMMSSNQNGHVAMNFGLGDVFVRVNYALVWPRNGRPNVTLRTLTKIPTASASRGLGAGEWDAGVFLSLALFANNFYLSTEAGYLWLGDSPGAIYQNPVSYAVGVGRTFTNGRLGMLLLYSGTGKIFATYQAPRQIGIGLNWRLSNRLGLFTNFARGLSETVPDFGFALGMSTAL